MARQVAKRHQRERIAGILVVCLGLVVLAIAIIALREPNGHVSGSSGDASNVAHGSATGHPTGSASSPGTSPGAGGTASLADLKAVPLKVLNNTSVSGLAEQATHDFEQGGWTVTDSGDLQNDIISTCAYYDPSVPNARRAARALQQQFPSIQRVKPKFPELPDGPIVVVLTGDYTSA
jgi:hypothetical protein